MTVSSCRACGLRVEKSQNKAETSPLNSPYLGIN